MPVAGLTAPATSALPVGVFETMTFGMVVQVAVAAVYS